ncbi:MAG: glycosyltransferase family 4 protein [Alphaproteobacteria bacterium]|nr:glycosyltransferase family 4 protein [Alphaproteobacteria bacterium]
MRILVTGAVDSSAQNATTLHLFSLADFWGRAGHRVRVVVPEPSGGAIAYPIAGKPIEVVTRISAKSICKCLPNTVSALLHLPSIVRDVRRDGFDVVYVRMSILSFILVAAVRLMTNAVVVTEHNGWVPDEGRLRGHPRWAQGLEYLFQAWDGRFAHLTRAVSPQTRAKLIEAGCKADRVFVGENGTDLERMTPLNRDFALREFGLDPKRRYIGFLGNLVYWQGMHVLIDALAICLKNRPDWDLTIAGDGIERESLEKQARARGILKRIHFLGSVPLDKANTAVGGFDIAVAPFIRERNVKTGCSPIKIRDYAGAGRVTVSSNIPAVADHSSRDWLILFEPDDVEELAHRLGELMDDDAKREVMGGVARAFAEKHYSWDKVAAVVIGQIDALNAGRT